MPDKYHAHRCILIVALFWGILAGVIHSTELSLSDQTLWSIENYMARSPAPWPDEWKKQYIDTIRIALQLHQDAPHHAERLGILAKGFGPYWESFEKTAERSLFDVHRTRMRWYVEYLMGTEFPTEQERQTLRDQFTEIWNHAADSLLAQFQFLDPNAVQKAKNEDLSVCYRKIEAPLMPVYLRPFSGEQVEQIQQRWTELRYARVDLWRTLQDNSTTAPCNSDVTSSNPKRDYELTKQSLSQLLGLVWMVVPQRPDYYLRALENQANAAKRLVESKGQARSDQQRLEKERSRQLLQTEHISFLLAALLETQRCLRQSASTRPQEEILSERGDGGTKGGGAYEIENASHEK